MSVPLSVCKICEHTFHIYSTYYSHLRKHKEPTIQCIHCPEKFYVKSEYYKHLGKMNIQNTNSKANTNTNTTTTNDIVITTYQKKNKLVSPFFDN